MQLGAPKMSAAGSGQRAAGIGVGEQVDQSLRETHRTTGVGGKGVGHRIGDDEQLDVARSIRLQPQSFTVIR